MLYFNKFNKCNNLVVLYSIDSFLFASDTRMCTGNLMWLVLSFSKPLDERNRLCVVSQCRVNVHDGASITALYMCLYVSLCARPTHHTHIIHPWACTHPYTHSRTHEQPPNTHTHINEYYIPWHTHTNTHAHAHTPTIHVHTLRSMHTPTHALTEGHEANYCISTWCCRTLMTLSIQQTQTRAEDDEIWLLVAEVQFPSQTPSALRAVWEWFAIITWQRSPLHIYTLARIFISIFSFLFNLKNFFYSG